MRDALLGRSEDNNLYFNYGFAVGDTLYGVGYNSLYTYRLGEPDVTEYIYNMPDDDGTYDYGIFYSLDTEAWTVTANASDVYLWLPANNSLYTHRGDSIYRYPLHSLEDLAAWARAKLP